MGPVILNFNFEDCRQIKTHTNEHLILIRLSDMT